MILGQRMIRVSDGQRGVVAQDGPQLSIVYLDRGEERVASRKEQWVPDELKPGPIREEEAYLIALHADRALRAYECHEPLKWWEKPALTDVPYDPGLVQAIRDYISLRETRPAG